jgi:predicted neuraminidase
VRTHKEFIFAGAQPFAHCHASTLVEVADGGFVAAWFGGSAEGKDDVAIWGARRFGGAWSMPERLAKVSDEPHWNPVLFDDGTGTIHLFFKVGKRIKTWETWTSTSGDQGRTWSNPRELVPGDQGGRGPVKNKPIVLSDGSWLAPGSLEDGQWRVFCDRSTDGGVTWTASTPIGNGVIQPTLWESAPGRVHMLCRSPYGVLCRSDSQDYGQTWADVYRTSIINNCCGVDLTRLADGALVLLHNPSPPTEKHKWGVRTPLTLAMSFDNGETWPVRHDLETKPAIGDVLPEFSYPAIIGTSAGIAFTYTWERRTIAFGTVCSRDMPTREAVL